MADSVENCLIRLCTLIGWYDALRESLALDAGTPVTASQLLPYDIDMFGEGWRWCSSQDSTSLCLGVGATEEVCAISFWPRRRHQ